MLSSRGQELEVVSHSAGTATETHKAALLSTATRSKQLDKKSSDNNHETKIK